MIVGCFHNMNFLSKDFYQVGKGTFSEVYLLNDNSLSYEEAIKYDSCLLKGWYELSRLDSACRIEFVRDFWLRSMPYHPTSHSKLLQFFAKLDDIGIYLVKERESYHSEMVYSLASNASFFSGRLPALNEDIENLGLSFGVLPKDYLSFFRIHNGFRKAGDAGLIELEKLRSFYEQFQAKIHETERPIYKLGQMINPSLLIPFYERFGLESYQCFYVDWYPSSEVGNVYYSAIDHRISDYSDPSHRAEEMAFTSFTDWLIFYLEGIETGNV